MVEMRRKNVRAEGPLFTAGLSALFWCNGCRLWDGFPPCFGVTAAGYGTAFHPCYDVPDCRLRQTMLDRSINAVNCGVLVFRHRNDQAFLPVDDLRADLGRFFRFDAEHNIVSPGFCGIAVNLFLFF